MRLEHRLHIRLLADAPYGRGVRSVFLDGEEFTDLRKVKIKLVEDDLHMVTLTFPAHVVIEEISEDEWPDEPQ